MIKTHVVLLLLFGLVISSAQQSTPPGDRTIARSRYVTINFSTLPASGIPGSTPSVGRRFPIPLFDGRVITAVFHHFDSNADGVTWVGTVDGLPLSTVTLVYGAGTMVGNIYLPDGSFTIRPAVVGGRSVPLAGGTRLHQLAEIDPTGFPPEAAPVPIELSKEAVAAVERAPMADSGEVIDVLVVYTPAAATFAGFFGGITNLINLAVSNTNTAYANSGVAQRIRLVRAQEVPYTESSAFILNLNNLRAGSGGLQAVPLLREAYGADLVALLVHPLVADLCGISNIMQVVTPAFESSAFSVTDVLCLNNQTFAHELGHNMGLLHDWYIEANVRPFTYAHGYVDPAAGFFTIMAYPDLCNALKASCQRLLAFSNPELFFRGAPTGIPAGTRTDCIAGNVNNPRCDADERLALNTTASTVANFRQSTTVGAPLIAMQPQSQSLVVGQSATLHVVAVGAEPLSYQWFRGIAPNVSSPVTSGTAPDLIVVAGLDGIWAEQMNYWVRVSNSAGSVDSAAAKVMLIR